MGGFGSGRIGWNSTTKLDDGLRLDINKLVYDGHIASFIQQKLGSLGGY